MVNSKLGQKENSFFLQEAPWLGSCIVQDKLVISFDISVFIKKREDKCIYKEKGG